MAVNKLRQEQQAAEQAAAAAGTGDKLQNAIPTKKATAKTTNGVANRMSLAATGLQRGANNVIAQHQAYTAQQNANAAAQQEGTGDWWTDFLNRRYINQQQTPQQPVTDAAAPAAADVTDASAAQAKIDPVKSYIAGQPVAVVEQDTQVAQSDNQAPMTGRSAPA